MSEPYYTREPFHRSEPTGQMESGCTSEPQSVRETTRKSEPKHLDGAVNWERALRDEGTGRGEPADNAEGAG